MVVGMRADARAEQRAALETLRRKGLSLTDAARLVVATTNSVAAWRDGEKPAAGRTHRRLLELSGMPEERLREALAVATTYPRGRLTMSEEAERVATMREAGLWPLDVRARKVCKLSEAARLKGLSSTDLIEFLGISRRTFYHYRSTTNTRVLPVEVVRRLQLLEKYLTDDEYDVPAGFYLLTLEGRLERASIILFDKLHYIGFEPGDPVKEHVLHVLTNETHFDTRTIRRYLPVRDRGRRAHRAVVAAFEDVARRLGTLV
jgi:hypothetical protein